MSSLIDKDRMRLIINQPFFATILLKHKIVANDNIPTATIDGVTLEYNPTWYNALNPRERETLLCHEVLHITNLHNLRRGTRGHKLFNVACDYAINQYLKEPPFMLPEGGLYDEKYDGQSSENIYAQLQKDMKEAEKPEPNDSDSDDESDDSGSSDPASDPGDDDTSPLDELYDKCIGDVADHPNPNNLDKSELEAESKIMIKQAMTVAKAQGKMPASIEAMFNEILKPKVDWRSILARWIEGFCNGDYSWNVPNPIHMRNRIVMPTLMSDAFANINIAIDTSGSMSDKVLQQAVSEVFAGLSVYTENNQEDASIKVIYCDAEINKVDTIEHEGQVTKPCGRGGTLFTPVFDYIKSDPPAGLIYITDGYGWDFPEPPSSEVIWIITECGASNFKPPFGDVIHMS
jgi:predicted metal-dependent peptidase